MKTKDDAACCELSLHQTVRFLKKHDNYIILTHSSPDGDTLGAAFALYYGLRENGKSATVCCPDPIPLKYSFFVQETPDLVSDDVTVIAVDVADLRLLGNLAVKYGDRIDLNIDHHISNTRYAKNLYLDVGASATCECIFNMLTAMHVNINNITAKALYTGIATDTGCFKYSNVTVRTHEIAAALYGYQIDAAEINRLMFDTKSRRLIELERMVLDTAEYHFKNRCMLLSVTTEMQHKTGCSGTDLEGIAVISRSVEGVLAGATLKQTAENEFKVSLRTYPPLSAAEICKALGGGGHNAAAGATLCGTLDEVKTQVLNAVAAAGLGETAEENNVGSASAR